MAQITHPCACEEKGRRMMIGQTIERDRNVVEERRRGNHSMKGIKEGKKRTVVFVIFKGYMPEIRKKIVRVVMKILGCVVTRCPGFVQSCS
jgi:hypothetical protein